MKRKFNFWGIMAVAAVMFSAGAGYAGATNVQTATHYNAETDPDRDANWQPITPGSPGENPCISSPRECKAMLDANNEFVVLEYGNLQ